MIDFFFHGFVLASTVQHIVASFVHDQLHDIIDNKNLDLTIFSCWSWSFLWVLMRDGLLVLSTFIGVIALRYCLTHKVDLSDSSDYVPINDPFSDFSPPRIRLRRRCVPRTRRKFRCTLIRFAVFWKNL